MDGLIDNKYIILNKLGDGGTAKVFAVKKSDSDEKFAAKVLSLENPEEENEEDEENKIDLKKTFDNEIKILENINMKSKSPYIINLIDYGEGDIIREDKQTTNKYLILECAEKGNLCDYLIYPNIPFPELFCKYIFYKILKGVQSLHENKICHRDLKLTNILLDKNYNPKICDFGFSEFNSSGLTECIHSINYTAPEILQNKPYDGFQVDIFSLGVIVFRLLTNKYGFFEPYKKDILFRMIRKKLEDKYWEAIEKNLDNPDIFPKESFRELYFKMVSYAPDNRPTIQEVLDSEWLEEIKELNEQQKSDLENKIREEFIKREKIIQERKSGRLFEARTEETSSENNRGGESYKNYFEESLKPKCIESEKGMNNFIKIKGQLDPNIFMNILINKLYEIYEKCIIKESQTTLKFNIIFEEETIVEEIPEDLKKEIEEENEDEDEDDEDILKKECNIKVKLFKIKNGDFLLRFTKKEGELEEFYQNIEKIINIVKTII